MSLMQTGAFKRDKRVLALVLAIVGVAVLGYLVSLVPGRGVSAQMASAESTLPGFATLSSPGAQARHEAAEQEPEEVESPPVAEKVVAPREKRTQEILKEAGDLIRAKRFDEAISHLHAARHLIQHDPRSYMAVARALTGKRDYTTARDFYATAIDKAPYLADAYFGFATTSEALGDLEAAIGGMRNYLHVQPNADPQKLKIVQARSAIWEWESTIGRGAWGPTKGVPPGFTMDELKRDGRGVAIKIPIPGTEKADGAVKYEIKHQDKFQIFKP